MSSSMNNNLLIQGAAASGIIEFANSRQSTSSAVNAIRSPRSEQANAAQRDRSIRASRGRGKQSLPSNRPEASANKVLEKNLQGALRQEASADVEASGSSNSRATTHRPPSVRGGNSKHRFRQQTDQLIDEMTALSGLDIDLVESVAPTSSTGLVSEVRKGRHATNNRKMNLTHLLNCKFERKPKGRYHSPSVSNRNTRYYHHKNIGSQYRDPGTVRKFNKQQFLQANCQFVVLNGHDYTVHKVDPDWPVDWDCIEEVRFKQSSSTETTCPICLEPPVAAKITRCGHIYCWTCMLHYLSLSDEKSRQCPICFEHVYKSDLRSVVSHSFENYSVEDDIVMRLMIRKKGCVEVEPYKSLEQRTSSPTNQLSPTNNDHYWSKANLVIVDSNTVIGKITQREREELMAKFALDKNEPEVCFIDEAMEWLKKRVEKLQNSTSVETLRPEIQGRQSQTLQVNGEASKSYLFYQCSDGQHIYLNPFSTKILCHEYGSLENCPLEIQAKILQMDWISMSEAWRKRFRYLEHLPLTCECRLIEIDFAKSKIISQKTYTIFEDQIVGREQERQKRRREERKREKIIQVEQNRRIYGIQPSLKINLDNIDQFPSVSDERYLGLSQPRNQQRSNEVISSDDDNSGDVPRTDLTQEQPPSQNDRSEPCEGVSSRLALSFKDIQLQEEARCIKQICKPGAWTTRKPDPTNNEQSSFAKLLVNAKTSQKEWTRHASSAPSANASASHASSSHRPRFTSGSDDGSEELRAPPHEFTINDFIDMNVALTAAKKKGRSKGSNKKGL